AGEVRPADIAHRQVVNGDRAPVEVERQDVEIPAGGGRARVAGEDIQEAREPLLVVVGEGEPGHEDGRARIGRLHRAVAGSQEVGIVLDRPGPEEALTVTAQDVRLVPDLPACYPTLVAVDGGADEFGP